MSIELSKAFNGDILIDAHNKVWLCVAGDKFCYLGNAFTSDEVETTAPFTKIADVPVREVEDWESEFWDYYDPNDDDWWDE